MLSFIDEYYEFKLGQVFEHSDRLHNPYINYKESPIYYNREENRVKRDYKNVQTNALVRDLKTIDDSYAFHA